MGCCQGSNPEEKKNVGNSDKEKITGESQKKQITLESQASATTTSTVSQPVDTTKNTTIVISPAEVDNTTNKEEEPPEDILKDARFVDSLRGHDKKTLLEAQSQRNLSMFDHQYDAYAAGQALSVKPLYEKYANVKTSSNDEKLMDKEGLEKVLLSLGVRLLPHAQGRAYEYFNFKGDGSDDASGSIDFFDFSSGISALVSGDDEEAAYLLFLCFDHDDDGYLNVEDIGRLLLTENQIAATLNGGVNASVAKFSKEKIVEKAKALMESASDGGNVKDLKLSFAKFMEVRGVRDERKRMLIKQRSKNET